MFISKVEEMLNTTLNQIWAFTRECSGKIHERIKNDRNCEQLDTKQNCLIVEFVEHQTEIWHDSYSVLVGTDLSILLSNINMNIPKWS